MPRKKADKSIFGELRNSLFFITINTNKEAKDDEQLEEMIDKLRSVIKMAFNERFRDIITFLSPNANSQSANDGTEDNFDSDWLADISPNPEVHYCIEIGKKQKRLHAHIIVRLKHYSKIHMNRHGWCDILSEMNVDNVYINFKGLPNTSKNLEEYLKKTNE